MGKLQGIFIPMYVGDKKAGEVHIRRRRLNLHLQFSVQPEYALPGTILDIKEEDARRAVKYIIRMEAYLKLEQKGITVDEYDI